MIHYDNILNRVSDGQEADCEYHGHMIYHIRYMEGMWLWDIIL